MDALSKLQLQHLPELRSLSSECGWLKSKFGLSEKKDLLSSETRLIQFANIVESLIDQIESLTRDGNSNSDYLRNLEVKISQTILPVREKLRERLREAKFYDSAQFPSSAAEIVPSGYGDSKQSIIKATTATENYYGNLNTAPVFPDMCAKSTSALTKRIQRNYSANDATTAAALTTTVNHTNFSSATMENTSDCFDTPKLSTPQSFFDSQQSPKLNIVFNKEPSITLSTTTTTTTTKKSRSKNTGAASLKNSPKSVAMVRSISASNSSVFSEGYTTSSSHNSDNDTLSTGYGAYHNNYHHGNGYHICPNSQNQGGGGGLANSASIHSQLSSSRLSVSSSSENLHHCDGNNDSFLDACERGFIDTIGDHKSAKMNSTAAITNTPTAIATTNKNNKGFLTATTTTTSPLTHTSTHSASTVTGLSDLTRHHSVDNFMAGFGLACETQDFSHVNYTSMSNTNSYYNNNSSNNNHYHHSTNNTTTTSTTTNNKCNNNHHHENTALFNSHNSNTLLSSPVHEEDHVFGAEFIMNSLNSEFHPCAPMNIVNGGMNSSILAGMSGLGASSNIIPNEFCTEYQYLGLYDSSPLTATADCTNTMTSGTDPHSAAAAEVAAEFDQFGDNVLQQQQQFQESSNSNRMNMINNGVINSTVHTNSGGTQIMGNPYNNNNNNTMKNVTNTLVPTNMNNYCMNYLLPTITNTSSTTATATITIMATTSGKDKRKCMDIDMDTSYGNNTTNTYLTAHSTTAATMNDHSSTHNNNHANNEIIHHDNNNITTTTNNNNNNTTTNTTTLSTFNDDEFRMSSRRRRRLSQIVPNPRKPRTADFNCSVCNELYQKVCEENPWWAVYHHECPKCHSIQVPRIDIGMTSNAIEVDPNVVALYGEGIDDGECGGFESYGIYEDDEEGVVDEEYDELEDNATVNGMTNNTTMNNNSNNNGNDLNNNNSGNNSHNTNNINNSNSNINMNATVVDEVKDAHPFDGEGLLSTEQASKLLVLMSHARSCSGIHTSPKHAEICRSTKFLMLHIRDCSGIDINGRSCRFTWCSPCKKMLRHLTRCFDAATCNVCNTWSLPDSYCQLSKFNQVRAPAASSIAKEKLIYTSKLETRDALAFKFELRKQQESAATAAASSVSACAINNTTSSSSGINSSNNNSITTSHGMNMTVPNTNTLSMDNPSSSSSTSSSVMTSTAIVNSNSISMMEGKVEMLNHTSSSLLLPQHQLLTHNPLPVYTTTTTSNYYAIDV